jgi:hypothetical protein
MPHLAVGSAEREVPEQKKHLLEGLAIGQGGFGRDSIPSSPEYLLSVGRPIVGDADRDKVSSMRFNGRLMGCDSAPLHFTE